MKANERFGYKHRGFYLKALLVLMIGVACFRWVELPKQEHLNTYRGLRIGTRN